MLRLTILVTFLRCHLVIVSQSDSFLDSEVAALDCEAKNQANIEQDVESNYNEQRPATLNASIIVIYPLSEAKKMVACNDYSPFVDYLLHIDYTVLVW